MDDRIGQGILLLLALIMSVAVHEFGHAWAANRLGDSLPRSQGRLTLNPIRHADPIGTLLFPAIMIFSGAGLLGWGRPVQTNPYNYTRKISQMTGSALVAVAGPAMNLFLAFLVSVLLVLAVRANVLGLDVAEALIGNLVVLNLSLLFFNLLPIPPLDGGAVLAWALPRSMQGVIDFLNRWGFVILLGLFILPQVMGVIMRPARYLTGLWLQALYSVLVL
jgi:Zn-dependent protease